MVAMPGIALSSPCTTERMLGTADTSRSTRNTRKARDSRMRRNASPFRLPASSAASAMPISPAPAFPAACGCVRVDLEVKGAQRCDLLTGPIAHAMRSSTRPPHQKVGAAAPALDREEAR